MRLDVYYRSCSRVYGLHGISRIVNCTKSELIQRCLNSLIQSMNRAAGPHSTEFSLTVIDDHSDPECLQNIQRLLKTCQFTNQLLHLEETGNGASLKKTYQLAKEATELIYFVEDDYLHAPEAIQEMLTSYQQLSFFLNQDIVLYPCDESQSYQNISASPLAVSANRHWRGLTGTTATLLTSKNIFHTYWAQFDALTGYDPAGGPDSPNEGNTINLIYRTVPCLGPIPALAAHVVNSALMPPIVNWIDWWNAADPKNLLADRPRVLTELVETVVKENIEMNFLVTDQFKSALLIQGRAGKVQSLQYQKNGWRYYYLLKGRFEYSYRSAESKSDFQKIQVNERSLLFIPAMTEYAISFTTDCEILCLDSLTKSELEDTTVSASENSLQK